MKILKPSLALLFASLIAFDAFAVRLTTFPKSDDDGTEMEEQEDARYRWKEILKGSRISSRYRYQENANGDVTHDRLQYQLKLRVAIPIGSDRIKLKLGAQTGGDSPRSGWDNTGAGGDSSDTTMGFSLRQFFVKAMVSDNVSVELGRLFLRPEKYSNGVYSFDSDSGVAAARAYVQTEGLPLGVDRIIITAGQLDPSESPDLLETELLPNEVNFYQVYIQGSSEALGLDYSAELSEVDDETYARFQTRKMFDGLIKNIADELVFESLWDAAEGEHLGYDIGIHKEIAGGINLNAILQDNSEQLSSYSYPSQSFYTRTAGKHASLSFSKKFGKKKQYTVTFVTRKQVSDGDELRTQLVVQRKF